MILSTDLAELFCRDCIAQQPALKFAFWGGLALAGTLFCLWRARTAFIHARLIADLPTSRVRSASQGLVELAGLARAADEPLSAPLSGRPCLWWRYRIERYRSGRRGNSWVTVEQGASAAPLKLDDGSGHCLILPDGGEVRSHRIKRWAGHQRRPPTGDDAAGHGLLGTVLGQRYRYTEELIADGDPLYVLGHFETADGGRLADVRSLQGDILRAWKQQQYPALVADHDRDGDGALDAAEWEAVRAAARREAHAEQRRRSRQPAQHQLRKPEDLPLLISTLPENRLARSLRWRALGFAIAFLVLGSLTSWLFGSRFGT
jgi:hypothetical protein